MKHAGDGGGRLTIPTEEEVEVVESLLSLQKIVPKEELPSRFTFTWGRQKQRSVLVPKLESSPSIHQKVYERRPGKDTAVDADKSPSTPLCFLPSGSGSGSDGADRPKRKSYLKKNPKKRTTEDLMEKFNQTAKEREILIREIKAKENQLQELRAQNLGLKARKHEINYSRNREDFQLWNNSMNIDFDRHHYHQQITMFAPPPAPAHRQQFLVDQYNGKLVTVSCTVNTNSGGRLGLFNQIDPRVKTHGETFDFMAASQPLDQNNYMGMDNDLRVRNAAAARRRRIMRMKENKNSRGACR